MIENKVREIVISVKEDISKILNDKNIKEVLYKKNGDTTWRIDIISEKMIIEKLKEEEIPCIIVSEEHEKLKLNDVPEYIFVLDPIDGSFNLVKGIPFASVSVAVAKYKRNATLSDLFYSIVVNIFEEEIFEAYKGKGSKFNGKAVHVNKRYDIDNLTGVIYTYNVNNLERLLKKTKRVRVLGAASLEISYIALNRIDYFLDIRNHLRNVDIAAAYLILKEAGGFIVDLNGRDFNCNITGIVRITLLCSKCKDLSLKLLNYVRSRDKS